jgi:hypothetical protein
MLAFVDNEEMLNKSKNEIKDLQVQKADIEHELSKLRIANGLKHNKEDILDYLNLLLYQRDNTPEYRRHII